MARTDGSAPSVRNVSPIASNISLSIALNLPSRASSTWATPPSRSTEILSLPIFRKAPLETAAYEPLYRERAARPLPHGSGDAPALGAEGRLQPHRDQIWLRHRPMRRLHRPCRRAGGTELPGADRRSRRELRHHDRGFVQR